jgi:hypothetical protein
MLHFLCSHFTSIPFIICVLLAQKQSSYAALSSHWLNARLIDPTKFLFTRGRADVHGNQETILDLISFQLRFYVCSRERHGEN